MKPYVFEGFTSHTRLTPKFHSFKYPIHAISLQLADNESEVQKSLIAHNIRGKFFRKNYFGNPQISLRQTVLAQVSKLLDQNITGTVQFIGQLSQFGIYFSPINFYIIQTDSTPSHCYVLVEVSNTPWNKKHCYLVDINNPKSQKKEFHVSPFNPMDMTYHWDAQVGEEFLNINIQCLRRNLEFEANVSLHKSSSPQKRYPLFMGIRILIGIYKQALLLFIKRAPFYPHPKN